jgi:hypothetical protein
MITLDAKVPDTDSHTNSCFALYGFRHISFSQKLAKKLAPDKNNSSSHMNIKHNI